MSETDQSDDGETHTVNIRPPPSGEATAVAASMTNMSESDAIETLQPYVNSARLYEAIRDHHDFTGYEFESIIRALEERGESGERSESDRSGDGSARDTEEWVEMLEQERDRLTSEE